MLDDEHLFSYLLMRADMERRRKFIDLWNLREYIEVPWGIIIKENKRIYTLPRAFGGIQLTEVIYWKYIFYVTENMFHIDCLSCI